MKCTKIGGSEIANARVTFAGGINYFIGGKVSRCLKEAILKYIMWLIIQKYVCMVSGLCSMIAFSFYGNRLRAEFQDPYIKTTKYVDC